MPEFAGEIREGFITRQEYVEEDTTKVVRENDSLVMLAVRAWNKRNMSPASVKDYELQLEIGGRKFLGNCKRGEKPYRVLLSGGPGMGSVVLPTQGGLPALSYLRAEGGYLIFFVHGLKAAQGIKAHLELGLTDVTGQRHQIISELCELDYGRLTCY
jgi:hypothetical protein